MTIGWFREARPASFGWNYAKTLAQTAVFWTAFLVVLPAGVSWIEQTLATPVFGEQRLMGGLLFVAFGAVGLRSGYTMTRIGEGTPLPLDTARNLVVAGPYRFVRNPMAVAGLGQGLGTGLWFGSPGVFAYVALGAVLWNVAIRPSEEADLARRFGPEFDHYRDKVRCWWPRITPYRPDPARAD